MQSKHTTCFIGAINLGVCDVIQHLLGGFHNPLGTADALPVKILQPLLKAVPKKLNRIPFGSASW